MSESAGTWRKIGGGSGRLALRAPGVLLVAAGSAFSVSSLALVDDALGQIENPRVVRGDVSFERQDARTIIRAGNGAIINYNRFDIGSQEVVQFVQPSIDSRVLNRISGATPTRIDGSLLANGQVYLVNPAGVFFGNGSVVNASRFVAAGADLSNADFIAGRDYFTNVTGGIVNDGEIAAHDVTLVGNSIFNSGFVLAQPAGDGNRPGTINLVRSPDGGSVYLQEQGSSIRVQVTPATQNAARIQPMPSGVASATTGAKAKRRFASLGAGDAAAAALRTYDPSGANAIVNTGTIAAASGDVRIEAPRAMVRNDGTISASALAASDATANEIGASRDGGTVQVRAGTIEQNGVIEANATATTRDAITGATDSHSGSGEVQTPRAGIVTLAATNALRVNENARVEARVVSAGGVAGRYIADNDSIGDGGSVSIASMGSLDVDAGSVIDVSGGLASGRAGMIALSGDTAMQIAANILAEDAASVRGLRSGGEMLLGGDQAGSIYVRGEGVDDDQVTIDGRVARGDFNDDAFVVSSGAIEGFAGDVFLQTPLDIVIEQSIEKSNGGLTLDAGRDIVFGSPSVIGDESAGLVDLTIAANFLDFAAQRSISDLTGSGTTLSAMDGDISLLARTGHVEFGQVGVPAGHMVEWTQAESLLLRAADVFVAHGEETHFKINVTDGNFALGDESAFDDVNRFASLDARASGQINLNERVESGSTITLVSGGDMSIGSDLVAPQSVSLQAGDAGTGFLTFVRDGVVVASNRIAMRAGVPPLRQPMNSTARFGSIDLTTHAPLIGSTSSGVGVTSGTPASFEFSQNESLTDANLPTIANAAGVELIANSYFGDITINDGAKLEGTNAKISAGTAFDPIGSGELTINDDLHVQGLAVFSVANLNADVTATGTQGQFYEDKVYVGEDVTLRGEHVQFEAPVNSALSDDAAHSLTIDGSATFEMGSGRERALREIAISGDATLGREDVTVDKFLVEVLTELGQSYGGDLNLLSDARLETRTSVDGAGTISIAGDVVAARNPRTASGLDFEVLTDSGLVEFGGDIGVENALGLLSIQTRKDAATRNGRGVEQYATIVGKGDMNVRADEVRFAPGEKLTVLGDLAMQARSVAVGDISTVGDLEINAETISLIRRPAGSLFDKVGALLDDVGLDYFAGGSIAMNGDVQLVGGGPSPRFGSATGSYSSSISLYEKVDLLVAEALRGEFVGANGRVLDRAVPVRISPPPPPPPPGVGQLEDPLAWDPIPYVGVQPRVYDIDLLRQIAVSGRGVNVGESFESRRGRYVYSDLPGQVTQYANANEVSVAATRFDIAAVRAVVRQYDEVLGENTRAETASNIQASLHRYWSMHPPSSHVSDVQEFANYLATQDNLTPEAEAAKATLARIRVVLDRLNGLGLTQGEYRAARDRMIAVLVPEMPGMTPSRLLNLIEWSEPVDLVRGADGQPY
ncbi:MAG: filamentous hemagglutinin N-terminal domain-containing protein [Phycisphaerales bacterium]